MPQDHPDIVARVYRAKLRDLQDFLLKNIIWAGSLPGHMSLSFRKGDYHMKHFLLVMEAESKVRTPDDYDKYISAELPDQKKYPELHRLVCKHMMHGPCGVLNHKCPCMIDGNYRFYYPRDFCETTQQGKKLISDL